MKIDVARRVRTPYLVIMSLRALAVFCFAVALLGSVIAVLAHQEWILIVVVTMSAFGAMLTIGHVLKDENDDVDQ